MTELSRDQQNLIRAAGHVQEIATAYPVENEDDPNISGDERKRREERNRTPKKKRKSYGSLCHSFPVLVRRSGLIQAVGYLQAKGAGDSPSKEAYQKLLPHVTEVAGVPANTSIPALWLAQRPIDDLLLTTQRLLDAWVYYKQFAESILGVSSAADAEEEE
jgi:CRISPR-associated protein Cmr5